MRVATFNILHGRGLADGVVDLDRFRGVIRKLDADILGLQEVDLDQPRSSRADLTAVAAEAMGAVAHQFVAAIAGTPGATWMAATGREQPGSAAYGIALLSRYPVQSWQVLRMPRIPVAFPLWLPGPRKVIVVKEEPRAVVIGRLETPFGVCTVANTHLSFVPGWNRRQLRRVVQDLRGMPGPRMIMGDFNMGPPRPTTITGMRALAAGLTFPSGSPKVQLDHILVDDDRFVSATYDIPELPVSDHRALVVDLVDP